MVSLVMLSDSVPACPLPVSELALMRPVGVGSSWVLTAMLRVPDTGFELPAVSMKEAALTLTVAASVVALEVALSVAV